MKNSVSVAVALLAFLPLLASACSSDEDEPAVDAWGGQAGRAVGGANTTGGLGRGGTIAGGGRATVGGASIGGATLQTRGGQSSSSGSTSGAAGAAGRSASVGGFGGGMAGTSGGQSVAGTSATNGGGSPAGGKAGDAATAGHAAFTAAGSHAASGASGLGGGSGAAGSGTAGSSVSTGGSSAAAGANSAGTGAIAGSSAAGAAGATSNDCGSLCENRACAVPPPCLPEAFGFAEGDVIPICIPPTTQSGATMCTSTTCNGVAGCPLQVTLGATDWALAAGSEPRTTDVQLNTTIAGIAGPIVVTSPNCTLFAQVPNTGLPLGATGTVTPAAADPTVIGLEFQRIDAPLTGLSVTSSNGLCAALANQALGTARTTIQQALLDAINARAEQLTCSDCREVCSQRLACVAP